MRRATYEADTKSPSTLNISTFRPSTSTANELIADKKITQLANLASAPNGAAVSASLSHPPPCGTCCFAPNICSWLARSYGLEWPVGASRLQSFAILHVQSPDCLTRC